MDLDLSESKGDQACSTPAVYDPLFSRLVGLNTGDLAGSVLLLSGWSSYLDTFISTNHAVQKSFMVSPYLQPGRSSEVWAPKRTCL